jgi:hypothetical protein
MSLPNIVDSFVATIRSGKDLVGSKSKKIAVKITDINIQSSCSEKMPRGFSSVFSESEKMLAAKWTWARLPTLKRSAWLY